MSLDPVGTRVCFFPETLNLGGIGRVTLNLAEGMIDRGIGVDLFLTKEVGPYLSQVPEGVRIFLGNGSVKSSFFALIRYLRKERPVALITAHPHANIMAILACKMAGVPTKIVVTIHTATSRDIQATMSLRTKLITALTRFFYPRADRVVAVSEAVADDLSQLIQLPRAKIEVIYNPVVTPRLLTGLNESPEHPWFRQNLPTLLSAGRLTEQKDFPTLLRAFAKVREATEAKLVILGEGKERPALEALIRQLGLEHDVDLPGYVANPFAFMRCASVFVLSSAWEGLPTVLIEALALGTPVIATDCPGGSRKILADGKYGTLVEVGDVDGIARAILDTLASPADAVTREKLRARGLEFSMQKATDRYLQLLQLPPSSAQELHDVTPSLNP